MKKIKLLNVVIALVGLVIIFLGLNVGFGGIRTLGWQGARDFISITDMDSFQSQDSHIRFIGGIWTSVGAMFLLGSFWLDRVRSSLIALTVMITFAGLFRLSAMDLDIIFSAKIAPSLLLELLGFPLLGWWISRRIDDSSKA